MDCYTVSFSRRVGQTLGLYLCLFHHAFLPPLVPYGSSLGLKHPPGALRFIVLPSQFSSIRPSSARSLALSLNDFDSLDVSRGSFFFLEVVCNGGCAIPASHAKEQEVSCIFLFFFWADTFTSRLIFAPCLVHNQADTSSSRLDPRLPRY